MELKKRCLNKAIRTFKKSIGAKISHQGPIISYDNAQTYLNSILIINRLLEMNVM